MFLYQSDFYLKTLQDCVSNHYDASIYFIIQRNDSDYFKPSNVDQFYSKELKSASKNGVNIKAISLHWTSLGTCYFKNLYLSIIELSNIFLRIFNGYL